MIACLRLGWLADSDDAQSRLVIDDFGESFQDLGSCQELTFFGVLSAHKNVRLNAKIVEQVRQ